MLNLQNILATHKSKNGRFFTIAIDGRGGSGKSTLAEYLDAIFPSFVIVHGDDYFEPLNDPIVWGMFNDKRFVKEVIEPLRSGNSFIYHPYDWHAKPHITEQNITVNQGFCLERCYSFRFDLEWDLKIWVETPKMICLERGLAREDISEEKALPAWRVWQQQEDDYIRAFEPQKKADASIDGTKPFKEQIT